MKKTGLLIIIFLCQFIVSAQLISNLNVSWIGNTFAGQNNYFGSPTSKWVPQDVYDIFVTKDGTIYTCTLWEEGGANVTQIKDADVKRIAYGTHGWGYEGGQAVTANSKYVYFGGKMNNEGGGLPYPNWPPAGYGYTGFQRRLVSDIRIPGTIKNGIIGHQGIVPKAFYPVVQNNFPAQVTGLAASEKHLFVATDFDSTLRMFPAMADSMYVIKSKRLDFVPNKLFIHNQYLWVLGGGYVTQYDTASLAQGTQITLPIGMVPTDFSISKEGKLYLADNGFTHQIHVWDILAATPTKLASIGKLNGIFTGNIGVVEDGEFHYPRNVGTDTLGNVFVVNGTSLGTGKTVIDSYKLSNAGKNWTIQGVCFVDALTLDDSTQTDIYSVEERFKMDWTKTEGKEANLYSYTVNPHQYPNTIDKGNGTGFVFTSSRIVYLNKHKYLFKMKMSSREILVCRNSLTYCLLV
jgi:hypothetical protein